ncbi:MAG: acyl-CoA dehydrogenase family protein [Oscillibacter sp.]
MVHYLFATEEQRELADGCRKILEKELAPRVSELEKAEGAAAFPRDVVKTLGTAGYCGLAVPEKWGGFGFDIKTQTLIYEEMAQIDAGFSFNFALGCPSPSIETTAMPKEEKQMWFDRCLSGDAMFANCLTEPNAGSDTKMMRTTAVKDGNEWVINGTKCFITNGALADAFVVSAIVDKTKGNAGIGQFFVEKDRGVKIGKVEDKMGLKLSVTSEVLFDHVRIPLDHMIGSIYFMKPDEAKELPKPSVASMMDGLAYARITSMVHALGIGQSALDIAVKYAKERRQFGKRIIDHEGLGFLIADMQTKVDAARALLYYSVDCLDQGIPTGTLSPSTKLFVSESMMEVAIDAIQVLGGYGYMKDYPVEKLARDIKAFSIFEGTNQINRLVSARMLSGKDPQAARAKK